MNIQEILIASTLFDRRFCGRISATLSPPTMMTVVNIGDHLNLKILSPHPGNFFQLQIRYCKLDYTPYAYSVCLLHM